MRRGVINILLILFFGIVANQLMAQEPFITTWKTDNPGSSCSSCITIPTTGGGYNYEVDWDNDGVYDESGITGDVTHDFGVAGNYTIALRGDFPRIYFNDEGDKEKILSIDQWGNIQWKSMSFSFKGCKYINILAIDSPDLFLVTDLSGMFSFITNFNSDIGQWDVSTITNMSGMFEFASSFNQDISGWNVSNVSDMSSMFRHASSFNQNLNDWNVSSVVSMSRMFELTDDFNQNLNDWNVTNVLDMSSMFKNADSFNGQIQNWNTMDVITMKQMFQQADVFNQPLNLWDVSSVMDMQGMFQLAPLFNGDISIWNVQNVTDISSMFRGATNFNQDISSWNLVNVTSFNWLFLDAVSFNQDISSWNTTNISNFDRCFAGASSFNQNISNWDVSSAFILGGMFFDASSFNQNLELWELHPNVSFNFIGSTGIFENSGLSCENYSNTLIGWANNPTTPDNKDLGPLTGMEYGSGSGVTARNTLIAKGWTFNGDTQGGCNIPCSLPAGQQQDFDALVALYNSTNGQNWTINTGWVDGATGTDCDYCNWYGVQCDGNDRVTCLDLDGGVGCSITGNDIGNNLIGLIPSQIGLLSELTGLYLRGNDLSTINENIGSLSNLITLDLHNCNISQNIPITIGNLNNLELLGLGANQFNGSIPSQISNLESCRFLYLGGNLLTGSIPEELGTLSSVLQFRLEDNDLTGSIPPSLSGLTSASLIRLRNNNLSGMIPSELSLLSSSLNFLELDNNNLEGCIPSELLDFCGQVQVDISDNPNLDNQSFSVFCNNQEGICSSCPTEYIITYPDIVCLGEVFSVVVDVVGPSTDLSVVITDGTDNFGAAVVSSFPVTIELGNPDLPPSGTYPLNATILDPSGICTSVTRSPASSGDITIQTGGFGFDVPLGPVCVGESFEIDMGVSPSPAGNPPYTYSFSYDDGSGTVTNLTESSAADNFTFTVDPSVAGTYFFFGLTVTDNSGCSYFGPFNVPTITVLPNGGYQVLPPTASTCEGEIYDIEVTITDGNTPYTVELFENGVSIGTQTSSSSVVSFAVGSTNAPGDYNYTASVTDDFGCTYTTITLADPHTVLASPSILPSLVIESCQATANQLVTIDLTDYDQNLSPGNTIEWNFELDGSQPIPNPSNLQTSASIIIYAKATSNGCNSEYIPVQINLTSSPSPTINTIGGLTNICPDTPLELSINGTFDQIDWSTGESGPFIEVTEGGMYMVTVTDGDCTGTSEIFITESGLSIDCAVNENEITIMVDVASLPYDISWSGSTSGDDSGVNDDSYTINNLLAGEYTIEVTDGQGCLVSCDVEILQSGNCAHPDVPNLIAFYNSLNESEWTDSTGWATNIMDTNCDPCDSLNNGLNAWFGITCRNNRVTQIQLNNNNLTGEIVLLNDLDSLELISLADNNIEGGNWNFTNEKLYSIGIGGNNLKTTIPDFNLPNLEQLICYSDSLIGPLPAFQNVPKLSEVDVDDNPFGQEIPNWQLDSLRGISFYNCGMIGELPELEKSIYLEEIFFDFNQLTGPIPVNEDKLLLDIFILNNNDLSGCMLLDRYCAIDSFDFRENPMMAEGGINTPLCADFEENDSECNGSIGIFISEECKCKCDIAVALQEVTIDISESPLTSSMISPVNAPCLLYFDEEATDTIFNLDCASTNITTQVFAYSESGQSVWFDLIVTDVDTFTSDSIMFPLETINTSIEGATVSNFSPEFISENSFYNISETNVFYNEDLCSDISVTYSDVVITEVQDSFNIIRTFVIDDNSLDNSWEFLQVIENYPLTNPCPHPDYAALEAFYQSTNGDGWTNTLTNNDPWFQSCDPCDGSWYGIRCNGNGRINGIDMYGEPSFDIVNFIDEEGNNLTGSLPLEIGQFTEMLFFDLQNNNIEDSIPPSIINWSNLEYLDLEDNDLSGPIPFGFGNLDQIFRFDVQNNNLSGKIPEDLGNIEIGFGIGIYLDRNNLEGCIPESFVNYCDPPFFSIVEVTTYGNPLMPNGGDYWDEFCDGQDQEGQPCGIALDSIISNCNCVPNTIPCPTFECIEEDILELFNDPATLFIADVIAGALPNCPFSFAADTQVDFLTFSCDDACQVLDIPVYNLETEEVCNTKLFISLIGGNVCDISVTETASVTIMDMDYDGSTTIFVDIIVNNFIDIIDYDFSLYYDEMALLYIGDTYRDPSLNPQVNPTPGSVNILSQDENNIYTTTDGNIITTLQFEIIAEALCDDILFTMENPFFPNGGLINCIGEQVTVTYNNGAVIVPRTSLDFTLDSEMICSGESSLFEVTNSTEFSSITVNGNTYNNQLTLSPTSTTDYTVQWIDNRNCSGDTSFMITVVDMITVSINGENQCEEINQTISVTDQFQIYQWAYGGSEILDNNSPTLPIDEPGSYSITVTDNDGCTGTDVITINLSIPPDITTSDTTACNLSTEGNTLVNLDQLIDYGGEGVWTDQDGLSVTNFLDFDGSDVGIFTYTFTTSDIGEPCDQIAQLVTVSVVSCGLCGPEGCLTLNPPTWTAPLPQDTIVDCINDLPVECSIPYSNDQVGDCAFAGDAIPTRNIPIDIECTGGVITETWNFTLPCGGEASHSRMISINASPEITTSYEPEDITISCEAYQDLMIASINFDNGLTGACLSDIEITPITIDEVDDCKGIILVQWSYIDDCTQSETKIIQMITVQDCFTPITESEYMEIRKGEIYDINLLENDILPDSNSVTILDFEDDIFTSYTLDDDGEFTFIIEENFFDTIRVPYEICDLNCDTCSTDFLVLVDEALKDIILTDIITPDGDGMNDALRFNFEQELSGSQLYIYNRWGDKIYEKLGYTNDWDASGYPGGVYFYVLRIGDTEVKKTLTVVK